MIQLQHIYLCQNTERSLYATFPHKHITQPKIAPDKVRKRPTPAKVLCCAIHCSANSDLLRSSSERGCLSYCVHFGHGSLVQSNTHSSERRVSRTFHCFRPFPVQDFSRFLKKGKRIYKFSLFSQRSAVVAPGGIVAGSWSRGRRRCQRAPRGFPMR